MHTINYTINKLSKKEEEHNNVSEHSLHFEFQA